ncbi:MAG: stage V sporulation protein T [Clostridia bacterium]
MKATGIVRRIDELGRVVIPKEIRRTLRIREGDPLEIFTDRDGEVILKKYSPIGELGDFAKEYAESLHFSLGHVAIICDKDIIIAISGGKRELLEKSVHEDIEKLMKERERIVLNVKDGDVLKGITTDENDNETYKAMVVVPVIASGDSIGAVILASRDNNVVMQKTELKVAETAAYFLGKQMEN